MIKKLTAITLCICLLAGCAAMGGSTPAATAAPAPTAAPQSLAVYDAIGGSAAAKALELYAAAQGVTLEYTLDNPDIAILPAAPAENSGYRDMSGDSLLAAAAARAGWTAESGACTALPLGRTLYAYWADSRILYALLGDACLPDVQGATWDEWEAFAEVLTAWIAEPAETTVTLNGTAYTLPAEKPAEAAGLTGVFAAADADAGITFTGPALTNALLAAGGSYTADSLTGALNGAYAAFKLERENAAAPAADASGDAAQRAALSGGSALLYRGKLCSLTAALDADYCTSLVLVPFKQNLTEEDIVTEEYNLTGLMNYPALVTAAYLAIPDSADDEGARAAASAILWLYTTAEGEAALTESLTLVTPWGTAVDDTALGAMQVQWVSTGILPEVSLGAAETAALLEIGGSLAVTTAWDNAARDAWVQAVTAVLAPAE